MYAAFTALVPEGGKGGEGLGTRDWGAWEQAFGIGWVPQVSSAAADEAWDLLHFGYHSECGDHPWHARHCVDAHW